MHTELIGKCDLLVENRKIIRETMKWESDLMALAGSSYYVGLGIEVDAGKLRKCHEILKDKAGILSDYRGNVKMPLICRMAVAEDPEKYFDAISTVVDAMKDLKWIDKEYKIMAAITIYDHTDGEDHRHVIEKMADLYKGMKEDHPWLTSGQDVPFAAMLAVSDVDTRALLRDMENCYQILKEYFFDKNAVQSLSHVLAMDEGNTEAKCDKLKRIWDLLKEKKHKYGTGYELAVLGSLCLLDIPAEEIVEEMIGADGYLKEHKGFGNLSLGKKSRLMYAGLMVMDAHIPPASGDRDNMLADMHAITMAAEITMLLIVSSIVVISESN
ncbi:MAG: DUF4003 family protein [Peptoniphilus sp.]|nr:DUF4003 family protein [Peptoniphilus sp.]MDY6044738.1 DUF4003 family protein [Peptoniphilus sp.]